MKKEIDLKLFDKIPVETKNIIFNYLITNCHGCLKPVHIYNIYKIQGKYCYCSKICYNFI